jgi:hypothetical protein
MLWNCERFIRCGCLVRLRVGGVYAAGGIARSGPIGGLMVGRAKR